MLPDRIYQIQNRGLVAEGRVIDRAFCVLAGSQAVGPSELRDCIFQKDRDLHASLIESGILIMRNTGAYYFTRDFIFSTPSEAANVVMGSHVSGERHWKSKRLGVQRAS